MTDEQRPGHSEAQPPSHLLGLEGDDLELARLADALSALEDGIDPAINHDEDPSLAALLGTVSVVHAGMLAATEGVRFQTFRADSRARVQQALPRLHPVASTTRTAPRPTRRTDTAPWYRRWQLTVAPLATAAAAVVATVFIVGGLSNSNETTTDTSLVTQPVTSSATDIAPDASTPLDAPVSEPVVSELARNLTRQSVEENLVYLQDLRTVLEARVAAGESVDSKLLTELSTAIDVMKERLATRPEEFQVATRNSFLETTGLTSVTLTQVNVEPGDQPTLEAAQASAQDGIVVAAGIISQNPSPATDGLSVDATDTVPAPEE